MLLKDDNLGLGAKRGGKEREETFGLGQLADIYGRLNGKSDGALEKEQRARADLGAKLYVQQRFGALPFVRGGFLVGDRIEEKEPPAKAVEAPCDPMPTVPNMMHEDKTPKKRKRSKRDPADVVNDDLEKGARPKEGETKEERRHRKEDRRKAKAAHKAEKVARRAAREERRRHKQEKRRRKAEDTGKAETSPPSLAANVQSPASPAPTSGNSTPLTSNPFNNRNAVRQRFIRQKRMASMNTQALKEILMLKA